MMGIEELKEGMKFKVANEKIGDCWNPSGKMDKWLGKVMTVSACKTSYLKAKEDKEDNSDMYDVEGWAWYSEMIDWDATERLNKPKPIDLLQTGMVVELRNGMKLLVMTGEFNTMFYGNQNLMFVKDNNFMEGTIYDQELLMLNKRKQFDIMKIYKPIISDIVTTFNTCNSSNLIWERKEPKTIKMTSSELLEKLGLDKNTKVEIEW